MKEYFKELKDPRQEAKVMHNMVQTIIMVICAVIAGCDVWQDIADFCRVKEEWFRESIGLELKNGIPSHDTFSRIFQLMDPKEFERSFREWVQDCCQLKKGQTISLDGKTVRGSKCDSKKAIHMVSAWAGEAKVVLGQMVTDEKSNEITAVPELLELLDIKGCVITADAMSCQTAIVEKINEKHADYVIQLKDNQPTMHKEVMQYMEEAIQDRANDPTLTSTVTLQKGHGRIEKRTYYLLTDEHLLVLYSQWRALRGFAMMKSETTKGNITTSDTHYYITSLTDVNAVAKAARNHWGVESTLHWCLDVTFHEDSSRIRKDHSAENMAVIRHIALTVLKNMDDKMSVARRRRHCAYDDDYLATVLRSIHA